MNLIFIKVKKKNKVVGYAPIAYKKDGVARMFLSKEGELLNFKSKEEAREYALKNKKLLP